MALLEEESFHEVADFLASPYHNKQICLTQLFAYLCSCAPNFAEEQLKAEKLWASMFPTQAYNQQRLKDRMSQLTRLLRHYLALQMVEEDDFIERLSLKALAARKEEKLFGHYQKAWVKQRQKLPYRDAEYFESTYQVARYADQLKGISWKREYGESLQAQSDELDRYFVIRKLQTYCEMLNRNNLQQQHYEAHLLEEIEAIIQQKSHLRDIPAIRLWYLSLQTLLPKAGHRALLDLRQALEEDGETFRFAERRAMYKYALNFCIRRINAGEAGYLEESFGIYQAMLQAGLLHIQGEISHTDFKNIATSGVRLGAYGWVADFIERYHPEVGGGQGKNVLIYCRAYLYAASGKAREAMRLLQEVQFTDVYYALSARTLLLQIYYEQADWDGLEYQLKAYQLFLQRNRHLSQRNRKLYLKFARLLGQLLKLAFNRPGLSLRDYGNARQQLYERIAQQEEVAHKAWLLQRLSLGELDKGIA